MYNDKDPIQRDALDQELKVVEFLQSKGMSARLTPELQAKGVDVEVVGLFPTAPNNITLLDVKSVRKHSAKSFCLPYLSEEGRRRGIFREESRAEYAFVVLRAEDGSTERRFAIEAKILRDKLQLALDLSNRDDLPSGEVNKKYGLGVTFFTGEKGEKWARFYYDKLSVQHVE